MDRRLFSILIAVSFLVSCSSLNKTRRSTRIQKRDVPFHARKSNFSSPRQRVLVLPIIDIEKSASPNVALYARDVLVRRLLKTDQFVVIKNEDFPKDIASFRAGDNYQLEKLAKAAAAVGISAVIEGKIVRIKAKRIGDEVGLIRNVKARMETTIHVKMIGAQNQRILLSETRSAIIEDNTTRVGKYASSDRNLRDDPKLVRSSVFKAFESMVPPIVKAVKKLSWEGRIAHINGEQVYVNAGRISGLQIGDLLKVVDTGRDIYDPESGDYIGHAPGRMKGTLEIVSYFGTDGAIAVIHSGSGFQALDRVEIY